MTDYIMEMRRFVGHRPLLQAGASVLLEDERGRLLLPRRADCHLWGYHGGAVELDEVVEEAAVRELFEETGLHAESLELFGVFSGPEMHRLQECRPHESPNSAERHLLPRCQSGVRD